MENTKEKNKSSVLLNLKEIRWTGIILCLIGFFMSRILMFNTFYTLGICYIGAMFFDKEIRRWSELLGLLGLLSVGIYNGLILKYVLMILLLLSCRAYMNLAKLAYNVRSQAIITGICITIINLIGNFVDGVTVFNVLVSLLEGAAGSGLVIILSSSLEIIYKKRFIPLSEKEMMSMMFLIACILGGMVDFSVKLPLFNKVYFRDVISFCIILMTTYVGGMSAGMISCMVISMVLVIIGYMAAAYAVIYALAVLLGALFNALGRLGVMIATGLGLLLGFAVFNGQAIEMNIIGAYLMAVLINLCLPKHYFGLANWFQRELPVNEDSLGQVKEILSDRLMAFSNAFGNIGHIFNRISDTSMKLTQKDIEEVIDRAGERMCSECSMKQFCWKNYIEDTYESGFKMLSIIEEKGKITQGEIPDKFVKACLRAESFAFALGFELDLFRQNQLWRKRFIQSRGLIGDQFEAVAETINELARHIEGEFTFNKDAEDAIKTLFHHKGIRVSEVVVVESEEKIQEIHIAIYEKGDSELREKVIELAEIALDQKLELEKCEIREEDKLYHFKLVIKKQFKILCSGANEAKETISGDTHSFMEVEEGHYLMALADGMGSGRKAQEESVAAVDLFENLVESGFKNEKAIKMINSILLLKANEENFSTMDITLIDEYTGIAEFLKMGAAASFIVRDGVVTTITSSSVPVGILNHIELEVYKKQLKDGDLLIMVTDGMLESATEFMSKEDTFKHFILEANSDNPEYLAHYLMEKSIGLLGGKETDDRTILVARIWKQY